MSDKESLIVPEDIQMFEICSSLKEDLLVLYEKEETWCNDLIPDYVIVYMRILLISVWQYYVVGEHGSYWETCIQYWLGKVKRLVRIYEEHP